MDRLVRDLRSVETEWTPGPKDEERKRWLQRYVYSFRALDPKDALGRALSGPATLAVFELASERIGLPLASRGQEDEQSCFSDNTHRDIAANVEGIGAVLEGDQGIPGLLVAIDAVDKSQGDDIRSRLERIRALAYSIVPPFDAIIIAPDDDPRRRTLQALAGELIGLAGALQHAGESAGAKIVIGGGG
jgi:putative iron-regulated protein